MKKIILNNIYLFILISISIVISIANYNPGTWLSGWDTLNPEFNFGVYFKRIFLGVWQEHQGLGAIASQAHPAEIPRMIIYFPLSSLLPSTFLRYSYFFLTLILGPLGVYYFIKKIIFNNEKNLFTGIASYFGGLFYLLNLGTLQHYYVPFEMFATQYAAIGWLFLFVTKYLQSDNRKQLLLFLITMFFASPMAHTSTLWYTFFACLSVYLLCINILIKKRAVLKKTINIIFLTLVINAFWILPNIYFILTTGNNVVDSKIHSLFSEEAFTQSKSFGNIKDLLIFKNFLFNWGEYIGNNKFGLLLNEWFLHLSKPGVLITGYIFFFIALFGIIYSFFKKHAFFLPVLSLIAFAGFFLMTTNGPTGKIFQFFQETIPFFKEAYRFPFSKLSIILMFAISVCFSFGIFFLFNLLNKLKKLKTKAAYCIFLFFTASFIYYMFPVFTGHLISPSMKVNIPKEYFEMFSWFNSQKDEGRIAPMPVNSFWGWTYYNWGYQGAGFIWFGLKQPILDREFDRWSPYNEQYYREISYAVYTQNPTLFKKVLEKYDIHYLLLDTSIIAPGSDPETLFYNQIKDLLKKTDSVNSLKQFGNHLYVYKVKNSSVFTLEGNKYSYIAPKTKALYEDFAYDKYGVYVTQSVNSIFYPFRNIIDNQNRTLSNLVSLTQNGILLKNQQIYNKSSLNLPSFIAVEKSIPANLLVEKTGNNLNINLYPALPIHGDKSSVIPIITTAQLPYNLNKNELNTVLSINRNNNFLLKDIPDNTPLSLGTVSLNTKEDNTIALYPQNQTQAIIPDFTSLKYRLNPCGETENKQIFGININKEKNGFSLIGQNTPICMLIPFKELFLSRMENINQEILLDTEFNYTGDSSPNLCIAKLENGSCINYVSKNLFLRQPVFNLKSQYIGIKNDEIGNLGIKIFFDTANNNEKTVSYTNFYFYLTEPSFFATFSKDTLEKSVYDVGSKDLSLSNVILPFSGNKNLSTDLSTLPRTTGRCSNDFFSNSSKIEKRIIKKGDNYVRYTSYDGSLCDHFSYQNLSQEEAYLIVINSRNQAGLPIRVCVTNKVTKRCDLYTHLSKFKDFKNDIFLLPPSMNKKGGFDININNFAVKEAESVNDLKSIQIIPIPYRWLSGITESNTSDLPRQDNNLLVFSQSYEDGWKAYKVRNYELGIMNYANSIFPFIFGKELKEHVLVNNWSNGWLMNNEAASDAVKQFNNSTIAIIFWPQYLEYAGFIILIAVFFLIILKTQRKAKIA